MTGDDAVDLLPFSSPSKLDFVCMCVLALYSTHSKVQCSASASRFRRLFLASPPPAVAAAVDVVFVVVVVVDSAGSSSIRRR